MLKANEILIELQKDFKENIITKVYPFNEFRASREAIQNYYQTNPNKPFCKAFIEPKLRLILEKFSKYSKPEKLNHLMIEQYEEY